jgi:hypothetical protein
LRSLTGGHKNRERWAYKKISGELIIAVESV